MHDEMERVIFKHVTSSPPEPEPEPDRRPCGCPIEYHMADCDVLQAANDPEPDAHLEAQYEEQYEYGDEPEEW